MTWRPLYLAQIVNWILLDFANWTLKPNEIQA